MVLTKAKRMTVKGRMPTPPPISHHAAVALTSIGCDGEGECPVQLEFVRGKQSPARAQRVSNVTQRPHRSCPMNRQESTVLAALIFC